MNEEKKISTHIRIPLEFHDKLRTLSYETRKSINELITDYIAKGLKDL